MYKGRRELIIYHFAKALLIDNSDIARIGVLHSEVIALFHLEASTGITFL